MIARPDPVSLLEQAYAPQPDLATWICELTPVVAQAIEPSTALSSGYSWGAEGMANYAGRSHSPLYSDELSLEIFQQGHLLATPQETVNYLAAGRKPGLISLKQLVGCIPANRWRDAPFQAADSLAVISHGPGGCPIVAGSVSTADRHYEDWEFAYWQRMAIHLGSAARLAGREQSVDSPDVEAVLVADGSLQHAQNELSQDEVELLRVAVKGMDRARARAGRSDPDEALRLWQGLLAGRWSLVEIFDSDGKRFLLARKNDPDIPAPETLNLRQRQVVFYASVGCSNREIAYALGLAETTISTHLGAALTKIGLPSRAELIRLSTEAALAVLAQSAAAPATSTA